MAIKSAVPAHVGQITSAILFVRDQRVILDTDLATLYGVPTKALNRRQAQRRAVPGRLLVSPYSQ